MSFSNDFWGISVADVIRMDYAKLYMEIRVASGDMADMDVIVEVTKRRIDADSDAERLACSRIISSFLNGPDVIEG